MSGDGEKTFRKERKNLQKDIPISRSSDQAPRDLAPGCFNLPCVAILAFGGPGSVSAYRMLMANHEHRNDVLQLARDDVVLF